MDFYHFINSKNMQNYLQEINYQFTTPEAAFVVYHCKKATLSEKINAWQKIINTMPDCSLEKRINLMPIKSFHSFLSDYIELQKRDLQNFCSDIGFIYRCKYHQTTYIPDGGWYNELDFFFSDYTSCTDYLKKQKDELIDIDKIRIYKCLLNPTKKDVEKRPSSVLINSTMEILELDVPHKDEYDMNLDDAFIGMCFHFPTPFKRGDILINYKIHDLYKNRSFLSGKGPFVLSYITTWNSKEMLNRGFNEYECPSHKGWEDFDKERERHLKTGDFSDMAAIGTGIDDDGNLFTDWTLLLPIDLEYYLEPLEGFERQLQILSCYEKGEISNELLTNYCFAIRTEELTKKIIQNCTNTYGKQLP